MTQDYLDVITRSPTDFRENLKISILIFAVKLNINIYMHKRLLFTDIGLLTSNYWTTNRVYILHWVNFHESIEEEIERRISIDSISLFKSRSLKRKLFEEDPHRPRGARRSELRWADGVEADAWSELRIRNRKAVAQNMAERQRHIEEVLTHIGL